MSGLKKVSYFSLDLRALALWRIALGAVVLLDIVLRLRDLELFYGDAGVLSRASYLTQSWHYSGYTLFLATGSTGGLVTFFALWAAAATCLLLGFQARWAAVVTWFFVANIQLRNPMVMDGGDDLLRLMLFWAPFLPISARWSLDARRHPSWAALPLAYRSVATMGVTLQVFVLYFFAAFLKTGEDWWVTHDALYYTLSLDQFVTGFGHALLAYPSLLKFLGFAALGLEYLLAALIVLGGIFLWARKAFYLLGVLLHLAIASLLNLGIFMLIAIACLTPFLPKDWLDVLEKYLALAFKGSSLMSMGDPLQEAQSREHLSKSASDESLAPQEAQAGQGGSKVGDLARESLNTAEGADVRIERDPVGYKLSLPAKLFCGLTIAMICWFNLYSIEHRQKIPPYTWVWAYCELTFEQQHWHLFAPNPIHQDGWYIFEVTLKDGTTFDAWDPKLKIGDKPEHGASRFPNQRWRRWFQNLVDIDLPANIVWRQETVLVLAKHWVADHPKQEATRFRLVLMQEITPPPGTPARIEPRELATVLASELGSNPRPTPAPRVRPTPPVPPAPPYGK